MNNEAATAMETSNDSLLDDVMDTMADERTPASLQLVTNNTTLLPLIQITSPEPNSRSPASPGVDAFPLPSLPQQPQQDVPMETETPPEPVHPDQAQLRRWIQQVQADASLSPLDKARKIQVCCSLFIIVYFIYTVVPDDVSISCIEATYNQTRNGECFEHRFGPAPSRRARFAP